MRRRSLIDPRNKTIELLFRRVQTIGELWFLKRQCLELAALALQDCRDDGLQRHKLLTSLDFCDQGRGVAFSRDTFRHRLKHGRISCEPIAIAFCLNPEAL